MDKKNKKEQEKTRKFINEYYALCEKYKLQIMVMPVYRYNKETESWQTVLETSITKLPDTKVN